MSFEFTYLDGIHSEVYFYLVHIRAESDVHMSTYCWLRTMPILKKSTFTICRLYCWAKRVHFIKQVIGSVTRNPTWLYECILLVPFSWSSGTRQRVANHYWQGLQPQASVATITHLHISQVPPQVYKDVGAASTSSLLLYGAMASEGQFRYQGSCSPLAWPHLSTAAPAYKC